MKALLTFCLAAILVAPIQAATFRVPADYDDIQDALDAASTGDTVLVAPRLYDCHLDFDGKGIVLISEAGPELTTLRLDTILTPLIHVGDNAANAVISGFTLTGTNYWGPAIQVDGDAFGQHPEQPLHRPPEQPVQRPPPDLHETTPARSLSGTTCSSTTRTPAPPFRFTIPARRKSSTTLSPAAHGRSMTGATGRSSATTSLPRAEPAFMPSPSRCTITTVSGTTPRITTISVPTRLT